MLFQCPPIFLFPKNCHKHTNSTTDIGRPNVQPKSTPSLETTSTELTNTNTDEQEKDNICGGNYCCRCARQCCR